MKLELAMNVAQTLVKEARETDRNLYMLNLARAAEADDEMGFAAASALIEVAK